MSAQRGEVWLIDFGEPVGTEQAGVRPAVILSADRLNQSRAGLVIAVPCTTRRRGLASHIEIDSAASGLTEITYAKCEDIKSISEERLMRKIGDAGPSALFQMEAAVRFLLDLA